WFATHSLPSPNRSARTDDGARRGRRRGQPRRRSPPPAGAGRQQRTTPAGAEGRPGSQLQTAWWCSRALFEACYEGLTLVFNVLTLLLLFGSDVCEETPALFTSVSVVWGTTTSVTAALSPAVSR